MPVRATSTTVTGPAAEFDAALVPLLDAPGLILDLRGNDGGGTGNKVGFAPVGGGLKHAPAQRIAPVQLDCTGAISVV